MAQVRFLSGDEQPPAGERFLLIAARQRKGVKVVRHDFATQRRSSFTYFVGPDRWAFWLAEGRLLADRLRLAAVYVRREFTADRAAAGGAGQDNDRPSDAAPQAGRRLRLNRILSIQKD